MALGLEFSNVIARKDVVAAVWPGGLDAFATDQPNYVEDVMLCGVRFMSTHEAWALVERLRTLGVSPDDVALIEPDAPVPEWLTVGDVQETNAVWLTGESPTEVVPLFTGFAAEGPAGLMDELRRWSAGAGIDCDDAPRALLGGERTMRFQEGQAVIDIDEFVDSAAGRSRLWAERDKARRSHLSADIVLCTRLLDALRELGARQL